MVGMCSQDSSHLDRPGSRSGTVEAPLACSLFFLLSPVIDFGRFYFYFMSMGVRLSFISMYHMCVGT